MTRPTLNDHLALDPRPALRDKYRELNKVPARIGGIAWAILLVWFLATVFAWITYAAGNLGLLPASAVSTAPLVLGILVSYIGARLSRPAELVRREHNATTDDAVRASVVADISDTYDLDVTPADVPLTAGTPAHTTVELNGTSVQAVLLFPSGDQPIVVSRLGAFATT